MNTIEQAREAAAGMRSGVMTLNQIRHVWPTAIDALIAENAALLIANRDCVDWFENLKVDYDKVQAELASRKGQEPVGVVVRVDSAMAPGCSYLQGTMIKNTPDGALLYLAAGAYPAPCNPLCELCIKRGYTECANVTVTTPLPMLAQGQRKP